MSLHNLLGGTLEGRSTRKPLIDEDGKRIQVTGWPWLALALLRSHIGWCAYQPLSTGQATLLHYLSHAKVTEQQRAIGSQQDILRLDIAVNHMTIMGILQGGGELGDIGTDGGERKRLTRGVPIPQRASCSILHHQIRDILMAEAKVEQGYNMRMLQAHSASFGEKAFEVLISCELELKEFDCRLRAIMNVLSLVDNPKGASAKPL